MMRSVPLRRTALLRGTIPVGAAARRRRAAGGKMAVGRPSTSLAGWKAVLAHLTARSGGVCEVCRVARATDRAHIEGRAQGSGDDPQTELVHTCNRCNLRMEGEYRRGRLIVVNHGPDLFEWGIVVGVSKYHPKEIAAHGWIRPRPGGPAAA